MRFSPHWTGSLFSELKQRRVFRAVAVYAAVGWAVIEVAQTLTPLFEFFPEWIPRAVVVAVALGLPFVIVGGWLFDLTGEGLRRSGGECGNSVGSPRRAPSFAVGVLTTLALCGAVWLAWQQRGGARASPGENTVAVLPFGVTGSPSVEILGEGMVRLLSMNLDGAGDLRAVDPAAVLGAVAERSWTQRSAGGAELVDELGAGLWVEGEIVEIGGRIRARARLHAVDAEDTSAAVEVQGDTADLFGLVDRLTGALLAERGGGSGSLSSLTTESVTALKAYLAAEEAFFRLDLPRALDRYGVALAEDSTFALAAYRMGIAAAWAGQMEGSRRGINSARRHAENLSARDRMLVEAAEALLVRGDAVEAERLYRETLSRYPQTVEAHYWLGETQLHYGPLHGRSSRLSRESFERVLARRPDHGGSLLHLLGLAARERRLDELDSLSTTFLSLDPSSDYGLAVRLLRRALLDSVDLTPSAPELRTSGDFPVLAAAAHLGQARHVSGVSLVASALTSPGRGSDTRATGHLTRAYAELARGRWEVALTELEAAGSVDRATGMLYSGLLAVSPLLEVPESDLEAYRNDLEGWNPSDVPPRLAPGYSLLPRTLYPALRVYALGLLEARLRRPESALDRARTLEAIGLPADAGSLTEDLALSVRSEVARMEGASGEALRLLERMEHRAAYDLIFTEPIGMAAERIRRGDLLLETGRYEEALDWYASASDAWHLHVAFLAPGHLGQARAHEALHNREAAAEHYRRFLELWADAEPEMRRPVEEARSRLAALEEAGRAH